MTSSPPAVSRRQSETRKAIGSFDDQSCLQEVGHRVPRCLVPRRFGRPLCSALPHPRHRRRLLAPQGGAATLSQERPSARRILKAPRNPPSWRNRDRSPATTDHGIYPFKPLPMTAIRSRGSAVTSPSGQSLGRTVIKDRGFWPTSVLRSQRDGDGPSIDEVDLHVGLRPHDRTRHSLADATAELISPAR
jgi:hypothetical protein